MTTRVAVLLSGSGTTLVNLLERIDDGRLDARVVCVVSSKAGVKGVERGEAAGLPTFVVPRREFPDVEEFSSRITEIVDRHSPDLVCCAGFLSAWLFPPAYAGRVMNIHPALIPSFCGKGYYGMKVHRAVVETGVKVSGCTVHFANLEYDQGPIIVQRAVPVGHDDTPEDVRRRVFLEECEAYPEAIRLFGEGRLAIDGRRVRILPPAGQSESEKPS